MIMSAASQGPGNLVSRGPDAFKKSPEGQWLLRNFAYHDILGSVTLGTKPLIPASYLEGITDVVDTYLGVGSEILIPISETSFIQTPPSANDLDALQIQDGAVSHRDWQALQAIEQKLQSWHCRSDAAPALTATAYAYRSAAMIYLYRQMRKILKAFNTSPGPWFRQSELRELEVKIADEVANTLLQVSAVPSNDFPECALLFPLFMAGGEATEDTDIATIRARIGITYKLRRFRNVLEALEVLEEVWEQRRIGYGGAGSRQADWEHVLARRKNRLLLC
ncbi:hypothetical protein BBP40_011199 [Neofusicoccum parvum]|nr:hypothetical protein BBP40_011199 [Neofusicoccum parvum]